jgi:hypothetical protein
VAKDERNLLDVLKFELEFLNKGGYGRSPRSGWHQPLIFEDSPTCMNYDSKDNPAPCEQCLLMRFVPQESRGEKVPCRHIPLNALGETIDYFYRSGTEAELEDALRGWLEKMIDGIERGASQVPAMHAGA